MAVCRLPSENSGRYQVVGSIVVGGYARENQRYAYWNSGGGGDVEANERARDGRKEIGRKRAAAELSDCHRHEASAEEAIIPNETKASRKSSIGQLNIRIPFGSPVTRRPASRTLRSPVNPNRSSPRASSVASSTRSPLQTHLVLLSPFHTHQHER